MHISAHARFFANHPPVRQPEPKTDRKLDDPLVVHAIGKRTDGKSQKRRDGRGFQSAQDASAQDAPTQNANEPLAIYGQGILRGRQTASSGVVDGEEMTRHARLPERPASPADRSVFELIDRIVAGTQDGV